MTTYYVSNSGSDSDDGLTPSAAWETISKVNGETFSPGDSILFERGGVWREGLTPPSAGSAGNPITFGAYGTGDKPVISGGVLVNTAGDWTQAVSETTLTDVRPAANGDDGWYSANGAGFSTSTTNLQMNGFQAGTSQDSPFFLFPFNVPQGATIVSAEITLRSSNAGNGSTCNFDIFAEDADEGTVPTSNANAAAKPKTTASVAWDISTWTLAQDFDSPDIASVLQEVVDRPGFVQGNDVLLLMISDGPSNFFRAAVSRDSSVTNGPRLTVTYDAGTSNLWYLSSVTEDPTVITHDGVPGVRKASLGALGSQWDYFYDSGAERFYVYSTANPTTLATDLEIGSVQRTLGLVTTDYIRFQNLDVRYGRESGCIPWGATGIEFDACDFSFQGINGVQFNNGSTGEVHDCTFTDWNRSDYDGGFAVHVINSSGLTGPVDIYDNTFTLEHATAGLQSAPIMIDEFGWSNRISGNTSTNPSGSEWPHGIAIFEPGNGAGTLDIYDNNITDAGRCGILLQGLEAKGAAPTIIVRDNRITDACLGDQADTEALRLRNFTSSCDVTVHHNIVDSTVDGTNDHDGIRVSDATGVKLYHNTVYGVDDGIVLDTPLATRNPSADCRNNIVSACRGTEGVVSAGAFATEDYNCWHGTVSGFTIGTNSITDDPLLTSPASGVFTLQTGSRCIDTGVFIAGINGGYAGLAPDMGAAVDTFRGLSTATAWALIPNATAP